MDEVQTFGEWIKQRRKTLDLTQEELAQRVGCATSTLKKIEQEERRPSREMAAHLAQALKLSPLEQEWFVGAARGTLSADEWLSFPPLAPAGSKTGRDMLRGYELHEQIGAGAYGTVYRAYQAAVRRDVAIKVIAPQYARQADFIRRFEHEAQLVARLEHPHIVPLFDYWRDPSGAYLVMRYVRGGNLHTLLRHGPLAPEAVLRLVEQLVGGLMVAHQQGIVHRDLKPSNILLDESRNAYLADFGIAKDLGATPRVDPSALELGSTSPAYSAPEQLRGAPITPQADIYSLGVLVYEMLAGVHPFAQEASTPEAFVARQLQEPLPPLSARRPELPKALDAVICMATAKEPSQRYADAAGMLAELRRIVASGNGTAFGTVRVLPEATAQPAEPAAAAENPYKGLRAFQEADTRDFFGREVLTAHLLGRIVERTKLQRFLAVVGPSGSGKSSVVRAGLLPALRRGELPGADRWFVAEMLPGAQPLEELELALLRVAVEPPAGLLELLEQDERGLSRAVRRILPADESIELVLVIDQFEELFTLVDDEMTRRHFLQSLLAAVAEPHSRLRVIATLRADFYDRPLHYPGFGELMRERTAVVLPLTEAELQAAIVQPARRVGASLEPELVTTILNDVGEQPGTLPLLQYALTELFERREGLVLTLAAYRASGGVLGALARRADELYEALQAAEQEAAWQLFLRLVTPGDGVEDTRRRVRHTELGSLAGDPQVMERVVGTYGQYRLLTFDHDPVTREPTVEVAHEALIRSWGRLRTWIGESREELRLQRRLGTATAEWTAAGRDPSFLATGARLQQFAALAAAGTLALNVDEAAYVQESLAEHERRSAVERERQAHELVLQRRAANRLRYLAAVLGLFLCVAAGLSAFAFRSRAAAIGSYAQSESQRLAAEANGVLQRGESPERAALLALRALRASYTPQADAALQRAARFPYGERLLQHPDFVHNVAVSGDGKQVVTGGRDKLARLWDIETGRQVRQFEGHESGVRAVAISRDGRYLLSGSEDQTTRLWDVQSGRELRRFAGPSNWVNTVAFSPDDRTVLASSAEGAAWLWDRETGAQRLVLTGPPASGTGPAAAASGMMTAGFSPDGRSVVTGHNDGMAYLWDAASGQQLRALSGHSLPIFDAAFSPDGQQVLTTSYDKTARLWNFATGELIRTIVHADLLFGADFSPDGSSILAGSLDTTARLWDVATGAERRRFVAHTGAVYTVAFSPDGRSVLTGGKDGAVRLWDLQTPGELNTLPGHTSYIYGLAFSPDGRYLLTGSADKTAILWDAPAARQLRVLQHPHRVDNVAFSRDGKLIVTNGEGGTARLWDRETGTEVRAFEGSVGSGLAQFSADGRHVLASGQDNTVWLLDAQTGQIVQTFAGLSSFPKAALSPDGKYVATATDRMEQANLRLWDAASGKELHVFKDPVPVVAIAFSPDGKYVLTGSRDNLARLWDVATGEVVRKFVGHTNVIWSVAFSPDGKYVLTGSQDKTARLWETATGAQLRMIPGHADEAVASAIFSPDGRTIAVASFDGVTQLTYPDLEAQIHSVCSRVLRELTEEERTVYDIKDNAPTCPKP